MEEDRVIDHLLDEECENPPSTNEVKLRWRKMSEETPKLGEDVLCLIHSRFEDPVFLRRIKPRPVPISLLHGAMCSDIENNWKNQEYHGWVPGCCFEFVASDTNKYYEKFTDEDLRKWFRLAKEVVWWMPFKFPEPPESDYDYNARTSKDRRPQKKRGRPRKLKD